MTDKEFFDLQKQQEIQDKGSYLISTYIQSLWKHFLPRGLLYAIHIYKQSTETLVKILDEQLSRTHHQGRVEIIRDEFGDIEAYVVRVIPPGEDSLVIWRLTPSEYVRIGERGAKKGSS